MDSGITISKVEHKEIGNIPFFRRVRMMSKDKFHEIAQAGQTKIYSKKVDDKQLSCMQHFLYVVEGIMNLYILGAEDSQQDSARDVFKSYKAQEYCTFQDCPLIWSQTVSVEMLPNTRIFVFPLALVEKLLGRVVSLAHIQAKAQCLSKFTPFDGKQPSRIFQLACVSPRYRVLPKQVILCEDDLITHIILILSGKLQLTSQFYDSFEIRSSYHDIFTHEIGRGSEFSTYRIECLHEGEILLIPKELYLNTINAKTGSESGMSRPTPQGSEIIGFNLRNSRARSHQNRRYSRSLNSRSKTYNFSQNEKGRTSNQTIMHSPMTAKTCKGFKQLQLGTISEIHMFKFMKRKTKVAESNFYKYIHSKAPDIVMNSRKEFAVVKPYFTASSLYVKNAKRKMKNSLRMTRTMTQAQTSSLTAFS